MNVRSIGASWANFFQVTPVLPPYHRDRSPIRQVAGTAVSISFCIILGLLYGLAFAILPPQLLVFFAFPILSLIALVVWALPATERAPTKLLTRLFFIFSIAVVLWPNYIAFVLPGLPWISLRRLIALPMGLVFLICYSMSPTVKSRTRAVFGQVKPLFWSVVILTIVQTYTLALSRDLAQTINFNVSYWFEVTALFFIAGYVLTQSRKVEAFINAMIISALILCIMGLFEYRNQAVLWAGHIPSFLQVQSDILAKYLSANVRDGGYRVTTTFSVSLSFAEYLALVSPFVVHRGLRSLDRPAPLIFWITLDLLILLVINLTQSRLGIIGWVMAHIVYISFWGFHRWRWLKSDLVGPSLSIFYSLGAVLFMIGMFTVPAIHNRTIGGGSTGLSDGSRQEQYALLWPKLWHNPLGYGGGQGAVVLGYYSPGGQLTVDSYVISLLMDSGILGFLAFSVMLLYGAGRAFQLAWSAKSEDLALALPVGCALIIEIQTRLVLSQTDNMAIVYVLLAMVAALAWRAKGSEGIAQTQEYPLKAAPMGAA